MLNSFDIKQGTLPPDASVNYQTMTVTLSFSGKARKSEPAKLVA